MDNKKHRDTLPAGYRLHWYELQQVIGRGAYGITYLATDKNLDQSVAIKEYLPTEFASRVDDDTVHPMTGDHEELFAWGLDRFLREARTLAKFKHPNIVRVLSVFEQNNTAYMVMEYELGEDLAKVFKKNREMSEQKLLSIFLPIIDGLAEIHKEGFIHRDIKPSNIYIRNDGSPVLLDFGSARQTRAETTRALTSLVTYGYAPFEQYNEGEEKQGPWTDIYALGASIYLAVVRKLPSDALSRGSSLLNKGVDTYEPASAKVTEGFSKNFLLAIDNAMQFRVQDRPQTLDQWREMLTGNTTSPPVSSPNVFSTDEMSSTVLMPADYISSRHSSPPSGSLDPFATSSNYHRQTGDSGSQPYQQATGPSHQAGDRLTNPPVSLAIQSQNANTSQHDDKRNIKIMALTGVAAACIVAIGITIGLVINQPDETGQDQTSTQQADNTDSPNAQSNSVADYLSDADQARITGLLEKADKDIEAGRLFTPQYSSAAYRLTRILDIDPENQVAARKLDGLIKTQVDEIRNSLSANRIDNAQQNLEALIALVPDSPLTEQIQEEFDQAGKSPREENSREKQIDALLARADKYFDQHRYLYPENSNAHSLYRKVLKLDPDNRQAKRGIRKIIEYYQDAAEQQISSGKYDKANRIIGNIATIDPASPVLKSLRNKLDKQNTQTAKIENIKIWLTSAKKATQDKRYTAPAKNNAVYFYKKVLDSDSDNIEARNGIINIENYYKSRFDTAVLRKDISSAQDYLKTIESISPDSAILLYARNEIRKLKDAPAPPDIEIISGLIKDYKNHFESRNINELNRISDFKPGRKSFIDQFFGQYESFNVAVNNFKYIGKEHKGLANISITNLINKRGNTIQPGSWSQFEIVVSQNEKGQWKIVW